MADHASAHHGEGGHHSAAHYVKIWAVLLVLLIISIAGPEVAPSFGAAAKWIVLITAFGIAFVKAWLVVKHFMHLTIEKPIVWYILITCLVFIVLFFAGVSPDVMKHDGHNWTNYSAHAETERALAAAAADGDGHGGDHGEEKGDEKKVEEEKPVVAPDTPQLTYSDLSDEGAKQNWLMETGEKVYLHGGENQTGSACVICHRVNGAGHADIYPSLVGQDQWLSDCSTLKNIIQNGMSQEIVVNEKTYANPMPPATGLTEVEVAAVATFVRSSWGNKYGTCTP